MYQLNKIFKLYNGQHYTAFSAQDLQADNHNPAFYTEQYRIPEQTDIFSYIEINCDKVEHIETTLHTLVQLELIELSDFSPFLSWFSGLEIKPDYFNKNSPDFHIQRFSHTLHNKNVVLDFYLASDYSLLSEKNQEAANRLKDAMEVLAPKFLLECTVPHLFVHKTSNISKI